MLQCSLVTDQIIRCKYLSLLNWDLHSFCCAEVTWKTVVLVLVYKKLTNFYVHHQVY